VAGYAALACALPYLALKAVWLAGGSLGVADASAMREPSMIALNAATAGMDLVAIALAMAFAHRWGMRMPAWLVLPPMWVATGLLARFVLAVPLVTVAELVTSGSPPRASGGPVQPWVYSVVYTGFAGMGVGLVLAFVLYARERWAPAFEAATIDAAPARDLTRAVQVPLANAAALISLAVAASELAWALGATSGLGRDLAARRTISSHLLHGIDGSLSLAAALGILSLVPRGGPKMRPWLSLTLAWVGAGSLFGWGLWHMVIVLPDTALARGRTEGMALFNLLALLRLLAGLTIGIVMLFVLAERTNAPARSRGA
jgi:hypothetical protein